MFTSRCSGNYLPSVPVCGALVGSYANAMGFNSFAEVANLCPRVRMWPMDVGFFLVVNLHHVSFIIILIIICQFSTNI